MIVWFFVKKLVEAIFLILLAVLYIPFAMLEDLAGRIAEEFKIMVIDPAKDSYERWKREYGCRNGHEWKEEGNGWYCDRCKTFRFKR